MFVSKAYFIWVFAFYVLKVSALFAVFLSSANANYHDFCFCLNKSDTGHSCKTSGKSNLWKFIFRVDLCAFELCAIEKRLQRKKKCESTTFQMCKKIHRAKKNANLFILIIEKNNTAIVEQQFIWKSKQGAFKCHCCFYNFQIKLN